MPVGPYTVLGLPKGLMELPVSRTMIQYVPGVLVTQTGVTRIYNNTGMPFVIQKVFLAVNTAPTGAAIIADVNRNGTTIFTAQANRPQIAVSAFTGYSTAINMPLFADGDYLTVDIDQVGSTVAGSELTFHIIYS